VRVIGVIDLKAGRAVHARGGQREAYEPVRSPLLSPEQVGDPAALARAYRDVLGLPEIYAADLDAISNPVGTHQDLRGVLAPGLPVMVDAGVATVRDADRVLDVGASRVVVGLETLTSFEDLALIVHAIGGSRVVFSLDTRGGRPVTRPGTSLDQLALLALAERALCAGASAVLILDLGRVGRAVGPDLDLVRALRSACACELLVGGGVRSVADLDRLADEGCDGALVGTALHGGLQLRAPHRRPDAGGQ
jgi:phosphoribosylformimino-5-aminoimidazole carboxamide ribotide isomerase